MFVWFIRRFLSVFVKHLGENEKMRKVFVYYNLHSTSGP